MKIWTQTRLFVSSQFLIRDHDKQVLIRDHDKPWFTSDLQRNIRIIDSIRKTFFRTQNQSDRLCFIRQRNNVRNIKKKYAKGIYINNIKMQSVIKILDTQIRLSASYGQIYEEKGSSIGIPPLQAGNNSYTHTSLEKANASNKIFSSISTIDNFEKRTDASFENLDINFSEVIDILQSLKVNKATGLDGISQRLLKYTAKTVAIPLTKLFNLPLNKMSLPESIIRENFIFL